MLKPGLCFYDSAGNRHPSARAALVHELTAALGFDGANTTLATTLAVLVIEKRVQVEKAFADFDLMYAIEERGL